MIDWSNIFNIAVVSAVGAAVLFLLVSTIVVAAKGKRKCNAFDVILRILSALLFIAATAMVFAAVLTMSESGTFRIGFIGAGESVAPVLVIGDSSTELPLPELFELLSTAIGLMLSALLFICSLAALVVDCLVANKKSEKPAASKTKKAAKQVRSPEQLKREAELEKIRRIGENAVRKTSEAAKAVEPVHTEKPQDVRPQPVREDRVTEDALQSTDWRVEQKQQNNEAQSSFVGISENTDPDFDTFDSFDPPQEDGPDNYTETETDEVTDAADTFDITQSVQNEEKPSAQSEEDTFAPRNEEENSFVREDGYSETELGDVSEFGSQAEEDEPISEEQNNFEEAVEADDADPIDEPAEEYESEYADAYGEAEPDGATQDEPDEEYFGRDDEENDITEFEREEEQTRPSAVEKHSAERGSGALREDEDYEPDRGIYIPGIRTIVKRSAEPSNRQERVQATAQIRASSVSGAPRANAKKDAKKSGSGANVKNKPARKPADAGKRVVPPQPSHNVKEGDNNKKLPVTRRYVILDRRNAVNMFGEYLKDREQAQKDKLKSSINTIIIE